MPKQKDFHDFKHFKFAFRPAWAGNDFKLIAVKLKQLIIMPAQAKRLPSHQVAV
jgi:hypothetical protein